MKERLIILGIFAAVTIISMCSYTKAMADQCTGTSSDPVIGQTCAGGAIYAGIYNDQKYMVTPSGCMNTSCDGAGGTDNTSMAWADAISWCANMNYGWYKDWVLPSQDELNYIYANRAALGGFASPYYWSSTENDADTAWCQSSTSNSKTDSFIYVRCVRRY
jgi:hypothetical protein